jgi:hypothetical protein
MVGSTEDWGQFIIRGFSVLRNKANSGRSTSPPRFYETKPIESGVVACSEIVGGRASSEDVPIGILRNEAKSWMQAPDKEPSFLVSVAGALDGRNQVGFGLAFRLWKLRVKNRGKKLVNGNL